MRPLLFHAFLHILLLGASKSAFGQQLQKLKIKGDFRDEPLSLVILVLKLRYDLVFTYDRGEISSVRIDKSIPALPLAEALTELLAETGLGFQLEEPNRVIIGEALLAKAPTVTASVVAPQRFDFVLEGQVRDQNTGETLPYATVQVAGTTQGTNTNVDGWFTLLEVPNDTVLLQISYIGYHDAYVRLTPETDLANLPVQMLSSNQVLQAVTVRATKKEQLIKASAGVSKISIAPA